jgi:hypothetical protein
VSASALALALMMAAAPSGDPAGGPAVLRRIYDGAKTAVVQVGSDTSSAGVVIAESGLIVTANALVKGRDSVSVTFTNGYSATARVVATSEAVGAALLRLDNLPPMAFVKLAGGAPHPNQATYGFSFASARVPSINFARVGSTEVARDQSVDDRLFTARFGFNPHSVGGAVLSSVGELLGVVLANDRNGVSFCANADALLGFIAEQSEKLPTVALSVETDPSGAAVLIDGDPVGHTPLMGAVALAGRHALVLRSPGLPDTVRQVVALGAAHQRLAAELFPGAAVEVRTLDRAQVWVDGVFRAQGSTSLWLPSGRHWVGAVLRGHRDFGRWVEVVEDRPLAVLAELPAQHATLTVATTPPGAEVSLDDNRLGTTPLEKVPVDPGGYELTLLARGYHAAHVPIVVHDGQDLDLGKLRLEAPHAVIKVHNTAATEIQIDDGPRHTINSAGEDAPPGPHRLTLYSPYQYRARLTAGGEDGQTVDVSPVFVAAGDPESQGRYTTLGALSEAIGGAALLVGGVSFLAAELDRSSNPYLSPSGHTEVAVGLTSGGIALALFAGGALINSLQPTAEMGWDSDPP